MDEHDESQISTTTAVCIDERKKVSNRRKLYSQQRAVEVLLKMKKIVITASTNPEINGEYTMKKVKQKKLTKDQEIIRKLDAEVAELNGKLRSATYREDDLKKKNASLETAVDEWRDTSRKNSRDIITLFSEVKKATEILAANLNGATTGHALGILDAAMRICCNFDRTQKIPKSQSNGEYFRNSGSDC